jgi:hypothetical protein
MLGCPRETAQRVLSIHVEVEIEIAVNVRAVHHETNHAGKR